MNQNPNPVSANSAGSSLVLEPAAATLAQLEQVALGTGPVVLDRGARPAVVPAPPRG